MAGRVLYTRDASVWSPAFGSAFGIGSGGRFLWWGTQRGRHCSDAVPAVCCLCHPKSVVTT